MNTATEKFYDEILDWVLARLKPGRPFTLGVNGPQGSGKTTLTAALCERLASRGKRAVAISVDDFYLTRAEQVALAARHPNNPYWQQRGYPGTHDVALGARILEAVRSRAPGEVRVPRYDKSRHAGQGDRKPESEWIAVPTPLDAIFLEGWMLGFRPVPEEELPGEAFRCANRALADYEAWYRQLDGFLQLDPEDPHFVLDWRAETEEKMRAGGKAGMSAEEIRAYAEKFLPAYALYLPRLRQKAPGPGPVLRVRIAKNRLPFSMLTP